MQVRELLEATPKKPSGNASFMPVYKGDIKQMRGSVRDWMTEMNISKEDIASAVAEIKRSKLFKVDFPAAGFRYIPTDRKEAQGTLSFEVTRTAIQWNTGKPIKYQGGYDIHANGQIRGVSYGSQSWSDGSLYTTPLQSPKPRLRVGDPVGSLVRIYEASMQELLAKWKKSMAKEQKLVDRAHSRADK